VRILLIDDEQAFARLLARRLQDAGNEVEVASTGTEGLEKASGGVFDVALVDVMLPELDGFELTRTLRARGISTPILMLTARDAVHDRVTGLGIGADDYLSKPFAFTELLARIDAITRRVERPDRLRFDDVEIEPAARVAYVGGRALDLTVTEFDLLECLMQNQGRVVPRAELKERVWGFSFDAETKVVDLYVHYVRRKLRDAGAKDIIRTVRGIGYSLRREQHPGEH
jgi:DNA-binding response OmpR family regulator